MKKNSKKQYSPLHIIIDSADGLGKTTVCELLSKKLKIPVIKMADMPKYFKENPEEASEIYNETVVQFKDYSFIQDRGWTTSIAYSNVYERSTDKIAYLAEIIGQLDEKIFFLTGSKPFRDDKLVTKSKWVKLNRQYQTFDQDFAQRMGIEVNIIDIDGKTPQQVCNQILKKLNS